MSKKLIINTVARVTINGVIESIELKPGVNILEGPPDSGKTVWLTIIDYLFGDTDSINEVLSQQDAAGIELYQKYLSASMEITIGEKKYLLERRWHEQGMKGKIFINEVAILAQDFSNFILGELEIPILKFPQGSAFSSRTWPSLSWRMMLRHIYRREKFWGDIADKQPESEQHAVLTQFLGIADKLFSQNFSDVVSKSKQLIRLEAEKDQFGSVLDTIGKNMSNPNESISFLTNESIQKVIKNLELKITELLEKRQRIIEKEVNEIETENLNTETFIIEKTNERAKIVEQIEQVNLKQKGLISRISEFKGISNSIKQEIDKLIRTKEAGTLFSDLKISHCPACDQEVSAISNHDANSCFLCHQSISNTHAHNRLDFEISQLSSEADELKELMASLQNDEDALVKHEGRLKYNLVMIERELAPLRNKMTALISPEIGEIDTERGRAEEQIENYKRLLKNLDHKVELNSKIDTLNSEIGTLESQVIIQESEINFMEISSWLEEEMANYLNKLIEINPERWAHKRPEFRISDRGFSFKVNNGNWSKTIGATSALYFLLAYNYGLLALSKNEQCNYPGLLIMDFAPELPNTETDEAYNESFVVEPFVTLCKSSDVPMQVIITGNSFQSIEGVNKIKVSTTWSE